MKQVISVDDNRSTTMATSLGDDPRRKMKLRKQELQQTFYETLKHGQQQEGYDMRGRSQTQMNQKISMSMINPQGTKGQDELLALGEYGKLPVALSLKQNNLKYHLMRDLLQKKNLEEILLIQERLQQEQEQNNKNKKRNIHFPKAQQEASKLTNKRASKMSSSESSSEMSDDVEVFVDTREPTPVPQNASSGLSQPGV